MIQYRNSTAKVPVGAFISPTTAFTGRSSVLAAFAKVFRLFGDPSLLVKLDNVEENGRTLGRT